MELLTLLTGDIYLDFAVIFIFGMITGIIAKLLKQPLIPAYIVAGIALRPLMTHFLNTDITTISTISEIGIAFMLFSVGLNLEFKKLNIVKNVAIYGGIISTFLSFLIMFLISKFYGLNQIVSIYLAIILSFSSTTVAVKLLMDKGELETLHGRIIVGILILQDVIAIAIMPFLTSSFTFSSIFLSVLKAFIFLGIIFLISKLFLKPMLKVGAKSQELLLLVAVGISFLYSILGQYIGFIFMFILELFGFNPTTHSLSTILPGFSITIGAFLAGLIIASTPYKTEISAKMVSLKDFFVLIFFVTLGIQLKLSMLSNSIILLLLILVLVVFIKPLITIITIAIFGYKRRISFLTGISMSQVSEFGLIISYQGLSQHVISDSIFSVIILSTLISISLSSYFIKYSSNLYSVFGKHMKFLESFEKINHKRSNLDSLLSINTDKSYTALLCGYHRIGYSIYEQLTKLKLKTLVVDYNPETVIRLMHKGIPVVYGDISDPELINSLNLEKLEIVVSTVPDTKSSIDLINLIKSRHKNTIIFLTATQIDDALELYEKGADYVIVPHLLGGQHASALLEKTYTGISSILDEKIKHVEELKRQKEEKI